jgi:nucleotide-binding universal stress UspA family protein
MNILVGYDGSNAAKDALKLAQKYAKAFGAKIDVVKSVTSEQPLSSSLFQTAEEEFGREIRNHFKGSKTSFENHFLASSRSSGENLVWFAELENIDEIIIGVRKRSKVGKLLLGSTAQYVILHAPCPVITLK